MPGGSVDEWLHEAGPWLVVGAPFAMLGARAVIEPTGTPWGELALIQLATHEASQFERLLGAFSWRGWHHPGPAFFYLAAPFYRLVGGTAGLSLGTVVVNMAAALGVVGVARTMVGRRGAWAAAAIVAGWAAALGTATLRNPWNPRVSVVAMLLLVVLAARAAARPGSWWALAGASIVGSVIVQSHIGPTVTVATVVGVAGVRVLWLRVGDVRTRRWWRGFAVAAAALMVMWAPVVWQQLTGQPGNLRSLLTFAANRMDAPPDAGGAVTGVAYVLMALSWQLSSLPFGLPEWYVAGPPDLTRAATSVVLVVVGVAAVIWGHHQRNGPAMWLGGLTLGSFVVAAVSADRVLDEVPAFYIFWIAGAAIGAPLAAAILAAQRWPRAGVALALVTGVTFAWTAATGPVAYEDTNPSMRDAMTVVAAVEDHLPSDSRHVHVRWDVNRWQQGNAILVSLVEQGHRVTVDDEWAHMYGERRTTDRPADVTLRVVARTPQADPIEHSESSGDLVAETAQTLVFALRPDASGP